MHLYKTSKGNILKQETKFFLLNDDWDTLINQQDLYQPSFAIIRQLLMK